MMDDFGEAVYQGIPVSENNIKKTEKDDDSADLENFEDLSVINIGALILLCNFVVATVFMARFGFARGVWETIGIGNKEKGYCFQIVPSKSLGGGRDWLLNVEDGTVSSKYSPDLVLGMSPIPVILAKKNSTNQFLLGKRINSSLMSGEFEPLIFEKIAGEQDSVNFGIGKVLFEEADCRKGLRHTSSTVDPTVKSLQVELVHNNFIKIVNENMITVKFWKIEVGSKVSFVSGTDKENPIYNSGGECDWTINNDGTFTRKNADKVLGREMPQIFLVPKGSPCQLVFESREFLVEGETVLLTLFLSSNGEFAGGRKIKLNYHG